MSRISWKVLSLHRERLQPLPIISPRLSRPARDRVEGTAAVVAIGIANGADIVCVHDVRQIARVCRMTDAIVRGLQN